MQPSRDVAKELPEMPCAPDVVHGSSIVKMSNCFWYNNLYMTLDAHVYEKCDSIGYRIIAYLYAVRSVYVLPKRVRTEVLEDRRGTARNELRESTRLE